MTTDDELANDHRRRVIAAALSADEFTPPSAQVRAEFGARSHRGRIRQQNDDHYLVLRLVQHAETILTTLPRVDLPRVVDEHAYGIVVADGIGHTSAGSVAARLAIATLARLA